MKITLKLDIAHDDGELISSHTDTGVVTRGGDVDAILGQCIAYIVMANPNRDASRVLKSFIQEYDDHFTESLLDDLVAARSQAAQSQEK